ncbi:serine/arginine repetitive matrix protein 3-like [Pongo pygmaeus]|uniref:serine/arginine repetitive matrix protein 3-like n=1 Tax=Pongo pygmaeus TaxID=9600 RepID=UPI00300D0852
MATALRGVSAGAGEPDSSAKESGARPGRLAPSPARPPRAGGPGECTAGKRYTTEGPSGGHARRAPAGPGRGRGRAGERAGRGRPVPGPAPARRPPKLRHTPRRGHAAAAAILCGRHLLARRARDSPFSSNKDINPTLLARDWDEVRRDVNPSPSPRRRRRSAARSGRARCRRRAAGRGCPSDVRGPHPSAPELGDLARRDCAVSRGRSGGAPSPPASGPRGRGGGKHRAGGAGPPPLHPTHLWNVLALTEQRRRRAQATLGPSVRPPRQASLPIGWRPATALSSLVRLRRQSRLSAPLLLPEAPLAASARLQPRPCFLPLPSPRLSQRSSRRSPWVSRDPEWPWWWGYGTGGSALSVWALRARWRLVPSLPGFGPGRGVAATPGTQEPSSSKLLSRPCFCGRYLRGEEPDRVLPAAGARLPFPSSRDARLRASRNELFFHLKPQAWVFHPRAIFCFGLGVDWPLAERARDSPVTAQGGREAAPPRCRPATEPARLAQRVASSFPKRRPLVGLESRGLLKALRGGFPPSGEGLPVLPGLKSAVLRASLVTLLLVGITSSPPLQFMTCEFLDRQIVAQSRRL